MAEKTQAGIERIFRLFGLEPPTGDRLKRLMTDERSYTQIRDDLLGWAKNQGGDTYNNALKSLVTSYFDQAEIDADPARITRIVGEIAGGDRSIDEVRKTISELPSAGAGEEAEEVGAPLPGGQTIRVKRGGVVNYYQVYEFPPGSGRYVSFQYNNVEQLKKALGDAPDITTWNEKQFQNRVLAEADFEEVSGREGTWQGMTNNLMREAANLAGIKDPGLIGRIASNQEMQEIWAQAVLGEWSPAQIKAAQRQTSFWKEELYPGIEAFYDKTQNPEKAYAEYLGNASPYLAQLGYERGADGTYKNQVKRMLDQQIDLGTFIQMVPVYERAVQNADFAGVFQQWAERDLGRQIDFGDWFDLQAGESAPDLEAVAEKATLQWVAEQQGAGIGRGQVEDLAARTQLSVAEAAAAFSEFNQGVLALGNEGLKKYGLSRDAVLSAAAGITDDQGRSPDEVKLLVAKTAREQALADDEKINLYLGFNQQGQPIRPGLQSLSPEGA